MLIATTGQAEEWVVKRKVANNFSDTRDAVVMAIENRGLVINYISHMSDMLDRTGADRVPRARYTHRPKSSNSARPDCREK
jgi:hypothetical protein